MITFNGGFVDGGPLGTGGITKTGLGLLRLGGVTPNTNTGVIGVYQGELDLAKQDGTNAIGIGGLSINTSSVAGTTAIPGNATVVLLANEQIDNDATVTLYSNGTGNIASLNLSNHIETLGKLYMTANTGSGTILNTGAIGTLILNGDLFLNNARDVSTDGSTSARNVLITGSGTMGVATFDGTLDLGGVVRNITVTSSATLANQGPVSGGGNTGGQSTPDGSRADATIETVITDGGINKLGARTLRLTNANTYAGVTTIREGAIRISNPLGLGVGDGTDATGTTVFDGASLQVEAPAGVTNIVFNGEALTLSGSGLLGTGALSATAGTSVWSSPISILSDTAFGADGTAVLALNSKISGAFNLTKVGTGTVLLHTTADSNFGTITVESGLLAFADDGTIPAVLGGRTVTVNSGGGLGLFWDGNGTNEPETDSTFPAIPATFLGDFGLGVNRTGLLTGQYSTPVNKTIQYSLANLPQITNQTITITNSNGYGLELTGSEVFSAGTPTFNVVNATGSNVVQGLTISAQLSGTANITKTGAGTLAFTNSANSFTGNIIINQGVVAAGNGNDDDNSQLGASTNKIILSPTTGTATFRATDNTTFNTRQIQLANTVNTRAIEVVGGKTLTLNTAFDLNGTAGATANLVKSDNGTLVLNAANTGWKGSLLVSAGTVVLGNNSAAGTGAPALSLTSTTNGTTTITMTSTAGLAVGQTVTGTGITPGTVITAVSSATVITVSQVAAAGANTLNYGGIVVNNAIGAGLQLSGGVTISNALDLNATGTAGLNGGVNFGGQLESILGDNTYAGTIALQMDALITADALSTLRITGGVFNVGTARSLTPGRGGDH
ncbi:MAG: autotransporter-associated beta strand repeat-containing protein [Chthoniobacter sp.]